MSKPGVRSVRTYRSDSLSTENPDLVAVEEPLEIRLTYGPDEHREERNIAITMRTPGHDFELAVGFLFTEGVIENFDVIRSIRYCTDAGNDPENENIVRVELMPAVAVNLDRLSRNFYTSSSCGVCGKASIEAIRFQGAEKMHHKLPDIDADLLTLLPGKLSEHQTNFTYTGGLHAVGLFSPQGSLVRVREDVGRHNALDKLVGSLVSEDDSSGDYLLLVSGRASFELVQKTIMAGIPLMAAVGAPSSLAIELAEEYGVTLVGFLRDNRFNVYTHPDRIR